MFKGRKFLLALDFHNIEKEISELHFKERLFSENFFNDIITIVLSVHVRTEM